VVCHCKKHVESVDHFLLHCDVARDVWSYFYSLFRVEWVMPSSVLDLLSSWGILLGRGPAMRIWKQVPLCVLWGLWRERNSRLFEDVKITIGVLCRNVLNMLYLWYGWQFLTRPANPTRNTTQENRVWVLYNRVRIIIAG
jgi:hypothetical protein